MKAICIVKVIRLQNPFPNASLTARGEAPLAMAPSETTTTPIATKMKASGNQRSAHAVKAMAIRTRPPSRSVVSAEPSRTPAVVLDIFGLQRGADHGAQLRFGRVCSSHWTRRDLAYCAVAGEGGEAPGAGRGPGRAPGEIRSGSGEFPPGRPPKPKKGRTGRQKLSPRAARSEINASVMLTSPAGCLALAQNFFTASRV